MTHDDVREALASDAKPMSTKEFVRRWRDDNRDAFITIGFRGLREEPATVYRIPPLQFVMFPTEECRQSYYVDLLSHARKLYKKPSARDIGLLHVMRLTKWCGDELARALDGLVSESAFVPNVPADAEGMGDA